jgi:hypothetical protein
MISAPTNFNHISHMGPGDGIQIQRLMDLPTSLETADTTPVTPQQQHGMQRVRSMLQNSQMVNRFTPSPLQNSPGSRPNSGHGAEPTPIRSYSHGGVPLPGMQPQHQHQHGHYNGNGINDTNGN